MSLSDDMTSDIPEFFNTDNFGVTAIFNMTDDINVIFDSPYDAYLATESGGIITADTQALARTVDVPNAKGKTLKIGTVTYKIVESRDDGTGITALRLSKD